MRTICCEKCGKDLCFFDRKRSVNNDRLNIHHDNLCSKCAGVLQKGLALMEDMYNSMIGMLREEYHLQDMTSADMDLLIFLAVGAVYTHVPDFYSKESIVHKAFLSRESDAVTVEDDLALLVDRLVEYGFSMNKKNAHIIDLIGYFKHNTLYVDPIGINDQAEGLKRDVQALITGRGIAVSPSGNGQCVMLTLGNGKKYTYSIINQKDIVLENIHFKGDPDNKPVLFTLSEQQCALITHNLDEINEVMRRQIENKRRNLVTIVSRETVKDLKRIHPQGDLSQVSIECVLIFIVKNMMCDPDGRRSPLYTEDGPVMDVLMDQFHDNLELFGRTERNDIAEYMIKNTLLSEGFYVQYGNRREKGWAFFTTKGYIIGFLTSRKFVYVFEDCFPNSIYYPCNECIYQGRRFLQIGDVALGFGEERENEDSGLIFFSDDISLIGKMNRFFNLNNIFYVMDRYVETAERVFADRSSVLDVKRISDKLFGEFSFLPFCQYDEWAAIVEKVKEDDFLLCQLIDKKEGGKKRSPISSTSYTVRIMRAFVSCAKELNHTLHLGDVSIAKAILWGYFNVSLIDTLSKEWIRVAGDMVYEDDTLEMAFAKYFEMEEIDSGKSYYLGLFIYYLMSKGVLPEDDFLDNYQRCMPIYRQHHPEQEAAKPVKAIEEIPENESEAVSSCEEESSESTQEVEEEISNDSSETFETEEIKAAIDEAICQEAHLDDLESDIETKTEISSSSEEVTEEETGPKQVTIVENTLDVTAEPETGKERVETLPEEQEIPAESEPCESC